MKIINIFLLLLITSISWSQSNSIIECVTNESDLEIESQSFYANEPDCGRNSVAYIQKYRLQTNYIPTTNSIEAIKTIPINIVVFLDDDAINIPFQVSGSMASYYDKNGNLTSGFSSTSPAVANYEEWINRAYYKTQPASGVGHDLNGNQVNTTPEVSSYIKDSRTRFVIKHYYFYENSTLVDGSSWTNETNKIEYHLSKNPGAINQINCMLAKHIPYAGAAGYAGGWYYNGVQTYYVSTGLDQYSNWQADYYYTENHLSHEFGHYLGLTHTYDTDPLNTSSIDYLDDVFPNPPFYFNGDNVMGGRTPNDFISPKQMGRIHRSLALNTIRNYAYGYSSVPREITSDETWDFVFKSYNDIVIKSGATLTLECRLEMVPQAKIVVETGGKLIIDGGIITSARCGGPEHEGYWQGVQVLGNSSLSQNPASNQGVIEIINEGSIENAINAISAAKRVGNTIDWSTTGGIVKLNNAIMTNNNFDIWIGGYHNKLPSGNEIRNISSIINSQFENNDDMLPAYNGYTFIGLWDIGTLMIRGNSFKNLQTGQTTEQKGNGIVAWSASISLGDYCPSTGTAYTNLSQSQATSNTPCTDAERNYFEGLYYGIRATNVTGIANNIISIDRAEFNDVYHGIFVNNVKYASVTRCDFAVSNTDPAASYSSTLYDSYGLYLDGSDAYRVEENTFTKNSAQQGIRGIVVNNSGGKENEIYHNNLNDLGYAIETQGNNRGTLNEGLGLYCNSFSNSFNDIVVLDDGIAENQKIIINGGSSGSQHFAAGNVFTSCSNNNYQNYYNGSSGSVIYYADANNIPQCTYGVNFPPINVLPLSRSCPTKLGGTLTAALASKSSAKLAWNSAITIYTIWKDGGNANLKEEVETTQPWDVYVEFNELIAESPYLSDEVLLATIDNSAFTSLMIKLLMVANTQASRNSEIMQAIYERIPVMPESYIQEIEAGESSISQLEILEANVSACKHSFEVFTNDAKRIYRMDYEDGGDISTYIGFVDGLNTLESEYELASLYLENDDYDNMNSTLNAISSNFDLNSQQSSDLINWQTYFDIVSTVKLTGIYQGILEESQKTQLETIAALENSEVSSAARALLMLNNTAYVYNEVVKPVTVNSARKASPINNSILSTNSDFLSVYPNPSKDYITLEYRTDDTYSKLYVEIKDATGKTVFTKQLKNGDNEEIINISELNSGVYSLMLYGDNSMIEYKKITKVK